MISIPTDDALDLATRARLLSLGFSWPTPGSVGQMRRLVEALAYGAPAGREADALAALLCALEDPEALVGAQAAFTALFDRDAPCPPYEGSYEGDPFRQLRQMSDVAGFYAAYGAEASGPASDRPDHVACELEFLGDVALVRATAQDVGRLDDAETCRETEDSFLRDHLGRWLGAFAERVLLTTESPLYAALAGLAAVFVADELDRRGIEPAPLSPRRTSAVEADELTCGAGGACASACVPPTGGGAL
jgi:TorA maturation chaperone TorD